MNETQLKQEEKRSKNSTFESGNQYMGKKTEGFIVNFKVLREPRDEIYVGCSKHGTLK